MDRPPAATVITGRGNKDGCPCEVVGALRGHLLLAGGRHGT